MKSLIVFPLVILVGVAIFSQMGVSQVASSEDTYSFPLQGFFDSDGHQVLDENTTRVGEFGFFGHTMVDYEVRYWWTNSSGVFEVFNDGSGANIDLNPSVIDLASSYGLIGVVVGMLALAGVIGVTVLSSGVKTAGMIATGTAFLTIWGIFSYMAIARIQSVPVFGVVFYFFLTLMYAVGIFFSMSNSSGGD